MNIKNILTVFLLVFVLTLSESFPCYAQNPLASVSIHGSNCPTGSGNCFYGIEPLSDYTYEPLVVTNGDIPSNAVRTYQWTINGGTCVVISGTPANCAKNREVKVNWPNTQNYNSGTTPSKSLKVKVTFTWKDAQNNDVVYNAESNVQAIEVKHIGAIGTISVDGSGYAGPAIISCGTAAHTVSIPVPYTDPYNSVQYSWTYPPNWSGPASSNSPSVTVTSDPNTGGTITVTAKRFDSNLTVSKSLTINRPLPGQPTLSFVDLVCPSETKTATASSVNATAYQWTSNGGIYVNGSQNPGIIGSSVGISGTAAGTYTVRGYSAICQAYSSSVSRSVEYGLPAYPTMYVNGQPMSNGTFCAGTLQNLDPLPIDYNSTYNWSLNSGNPNNAYLSPYGATASFNSYVAECFGIGLQISNSCGTISTGISLCAQNCFAKYSVFPNPVKDYINIEFESIENASALPDEIVLLSEKSIEAVKYVNVQEMYSKKQLEEGKKVEIAVSELPRGIYYLHVKNSRKKGEELDIIRLLLE